MFLESVLSEGLKIIGKFIPDAEAKAKAELELMTLIQEKELAYLEAQKQSDVSQATTNTQESQSADPFVARWRPFIGWVCGVAFAYHYVLQPFLMFLMASIDHAITLPSFEMDALLTVLFGMLGLGGLRTFEKVRGVAR